MSRLSEITNLPLSKPIEIEPIGFACQGYAVISFSQILVSGGYCDFPRFVQILQSARLPCQLNSNPICILSFWEASIFEWNKILYTSFLYILSKAQQRILLLYMYNMIYKYNDLKIIRLNSKN